MPVSFIRIDKETDQDAAITISLGEKSVSIPYAALSGTRLAQEDVLIQLLQEGLDVRQRKNQLPQDDPNRGTDPGLENLFHDGQWLVSRSVIVDSAPWDEELGRFQIGLRRALPE